MVSCFSTACIFKGNIDKIHTSITLWRKKKISKALLQRPHWEKNYASCIKGRNQIINCIKRYWEKSLCIEMSQSNITAWQPPGETQRRLESAKVENTRAMGDFSSFSERVIAGRVKIELSDLLIITYLKPWIKTHKERSSSWLSLESALSMDQNQSITVIIATKCFYTPV